MGTKFDSRGPAYVALHRRGERGMALATVMMLVLLVAVVSASLLAMVASEGGIAGSDLQRTRTFYAAQAGIEKMTNGFSALFTRTSNPATTDLNAVAADYPTELYTEGFDFSQQFIQQGTRRNVVIPNGSFAGLNASVVPYTLTSTVKLRNTGTEVSLQRNINNYLIPIFQFGLFSDEDLELHPGAPFYFNGRVHANGNLYLNGDVTFLSKVTTANEVVTSVLRNGVARVPDVKFNISNTLAKLTLGSVMADSADANSKGGPNFPTALQQGGRGNFPGHAMGIPNPDWDTNSVAAANGTNNQFGGQLLTRTTGAKPLLLPFQLGGAPTRELIKRQLPNEATANPVLSQSRYHTKATIRILLDDEGASATDASAILSTRGVLLSSFVPSRLGAGTTTALTRFGDDGTAVAFDVSNPVRQKLDALPAASPSPSPTPRLQDATTVRGVQATPVYNTAGTPSSGVNIPQGAGLTGRILIEIVKPDGTTVDVTQQILSMGVTEGEPNGIVYMQRPLWASYVQGSRDRNIANNINLVYLTDWTSTSPTHETRAAVDGEISAAAFNRDTTYGHFTTADNSFDDDAHILTSPFLPTSNPVREAFPCGANPVPSTCVNRIVPINLYNVREGAITDSLLVDAVYERGITSVVELNMRNLARWVVGTFDGNLLSGTPAVSSNIASPDGYIIYVSDRRGDKVRAQGGINTTNGIVDNEDIYGNNGADGAGCSTSQDQNGCELGEDVNGDGILRKDLTELPVPTVFSSGTDINTRADAVASWSNPNNYFHRALRLFNGENLQVTGPRDALTTTHGITVATENMVYIWGNYNTTGITAQPTGGATLNDGTYTGGQVPASIVADAFFPLSKTWFDSSSAMYPQGGGLRPADAGLTLITQGTAVRSGIIAGNNLSALAGDPSAGNVSPNDERRLSGGLHNYPRFLENWGNQRWNFVGSLIPLYRSTQALGPYQADGAIYGAPIRNWAFDITFTDPARLPPGTPLFQFIEPTGFRQIY
jgi:hypothetical protein